MHAWQQWLADSVGTGTVACGATTCAIAAAGQMEAGNPAAPLNAVSHILWGDEAAAHDDVSAKYTGAGLGLNALAIVGWAAVYEAAFGNAARRGDAAMALAGGALTSALAYVVDYHVVPRRLTPGFELRLSHRSLLAIYGTLALSLGVGGLMKGRR